MEPSPRRSKREHQPSAKAVASSASFSVASSSPSTSRRSQRRRVPPSASASTPMSTVVRGTVTSLASSHLVSVDAVGPNGQRRRLRAAAHTSSVPYAGVHYTYPSGVRNDSKVLGRYSSRDCVLLCEVILSQLEKQTLASTVLDEDKSPAFIKWEPVAKKMETMHRLAMTSRECQLLWKFLAYGQIPVLDAEKKELLPDSDEEEFHQSPKEINARLAAERAKVTEQKQEQIAASDGTTGAVQDKQGVAIEETAAKSSDELQQNKANESKEGEQGDKLDAQEKDREPSIRLYPTYSLPTGAPDAWYRPFGPKDASPLTFVASRFLRRKPTPSPAQLWLGKSTVTSGSSTLGTADLKRKQVEPVNHFAEAAKRPKLVTRPITTPPRAHKPSSTPLFTATRARSELEFFELRLRDEQAKKTPGATFGLSAADVQRRFGEASAEVRRQCQTLAAHDIERFNREILRVHIRQKTMADNTKPTPILVSTPSPASKPAALPTQASSTELVSTASAGNAGASSTKAPGPAAALLEHVTAVAARVAKTESTALPTNTSSASNSAQVQKADGGTTLANPDAK